MKRWRTPRRWSVLMALLASQAFGHALLVQSVPADGAVLSQSPGEAVLHFSENIEPRFSSVQLQDAQGLSIAVAPGARSDPDPHSMALHLPALEAGRYTLIWSALASDGHRSQGRVVFQIR